MREKSIVLVWAKDAGKFAEDILSQPALIRNQIEEVVVLGSELKVGDLKALRRITDVAVDIDDEYGAEKFHTELFLLGRCFEKARSTGDVVSLIPYSPMDKASLELSKRTGLSVTPWSTFTKASEARKKAAPVPEEGAMPTKEKKPVKTEKKGRKPSTKTGDSVLSLIENSALSDEDKQFFSREDNLELIRKSIRSASDANIGLPFQLKLHFGDRGESLGSQVLVKHFAKLRKEL